MVMAKQDDDMPRPATAKKIESVGVAENTNTAPKTDIKDLLRERADPNVVVSTVKKIYKLVTSFDTYRILKLDHKQKENCSLEELALLLILLQYQKINHLKLQAQNNQIKPDSLI